MSKGKVRKVSIAEFKGMNVSISARKLPSGVGTDDVNGRRDFPFMGSWGPRKGYQRMCTAGSAILRESTAIESIFQFTPTTSKETHFWTDRSNPNLESSTSTVIVVTQGGDIKAHHALNPRF